MIRITDLSLFLLNFFQPREALLKYAKLAEEDPQWTGGELFKSIVFGCFRVAAIWHD